MATKKKMLMAAAGGAGEPGPDVTDVFSTYLYDGNGSTQTITNDIDLAGEGGLVWLKGRNNGNSHYLHDSERTITKWLQSQTTAAEQTNGPVTSFNSNGFSLGFGQGNGGANSSGDTFASWTFRKAPKFFDVVTYTGDGVAGREIPHSLGSDVGLLIIKCTSASNFWFTHHISRPSGALFLDSTDAETTGSTKYYMGNDVSVIQPTSTHFTVGGSTAGTMVNGSGNTYVAYLFAHNDGDGEFGPDGDQDIIKCGSYTGNGSSNGPEIDLGFEPQWVMIKASSSIGNWHMFDTMRGIPTGGNDPWLNADESSAENPNSPALDVTATGFKLADNSAGWNGSSITYIYMAIRRGPLAQPESATDVFEVFETTNTGTASTIGSMGPSDFILNKRTDAAATWRALDRLRGGSMLRTDSTDTETSSGFLEWDKMGGVFVTAAGAPYITNDAQAHWLWKRAPGFCDVVAYTGNGTNPHNISHNLGVAPEMMWVKRRDSTGNWEVYYDTGNPSTNNGLGLLRLNSTGTDLNGTFVWGNTHPTDSVFTVGSNGTNQSGANFIAYLFATVPGVSKVGSYTGNSTGNASGITQTIDCGFTSGARFVLIKKTNGTGSWAVFDTERGIISGNDPYLQLNDTAAESTVTDAIDPHSSGFTLTSSTLFNSNGDTYIFYAIA